MLEAASLHQEGLTCDATSEPDCTSAYGVALLEGFKKQREGVA